MKRYRIIYNGQVVGVGFRKAIYHLAKKYQLTGFVCNQDENNVLLEIQGEPISLEKYLIDINNLESKYLIIDDYFVKEIEIIKDYNFRIK